MRMLPEMEKKGLWHRRSSIYSPVDGSGSDKPATHGSGPGRCLAAQFVAQVVRWAGSKPHCAPMKVQQ